MNKPWPEPEPAPGSRMAIRPSLCRTILGLFARSSPCSIALFDTNQVQASHGYNLNPFCRALTAEGSSLREACRLFHTRLNRRALTDGKPHSSNCHAGLHCFALPVQSEDGIFGLLAGGQIMIEAGGRKGEKKSPHRAETPLSPALKRLKAGIPTRTLALVAQDISHLSQLSGELCRICLQTQDAEQRALQTSLVADISAMAEGGFGVAELLQASMRHIARAMRMDNCAIILVERENHNWISREYTLENLVDPVPVPFNPSEGIIGQVITAQEPYIAVDSAGDPKISPSFWQRFGAKSLLAVPMKLGSKVIGVLLLGTTHQHRILTTREVEGAAALALEIALVLELTRLSDETRRRNIEIEQAREKMQATFTRMGDALGTALNLHQLLHLIVEMSLRLTDAKAGSIYLIENRQLATQVAIGLDREATREVKYRVRQSLMGWGADAESEAPDGQRAEELIYEETMPKGRMQSYLGIPLAFQDRIKGVLNIYCREQRRFSIDEVKILSAFGAQASLAINNAQLFQEQQRKALEATNMYQAARAIGQGLGLNEVLQAGVRQFIRLARLDRCLIFLFDERSREFSLAGSAGLSPEQEDFFSVFRLPMADIRGELWEVISQGRALILDHPPQESPALKKLFTLLPTNTCLILPLYAKENLLGLLYLDDSTLPTDFSPAQVRLVMTLAIQLATAIQRASLIKELEDNYSQTRALYQVSTAITATLSISRVLNLIVDRASRLIPNASFSLLTWDEDLRAYALKASHRLPDSLNNEEFHATLSRLGPQQKRPTTFYAEETGHPDLSAPLQRGEMGGVMIVPLKAQKKVLGMLNCFAPQGVRFSRQQIRMMRSFANQAVIAIENARLYGVIKDKVHELATLFEVGKSITSTLDQSKLLENINEQIIKVMKADACSIMHLDENTKIMRIISAQGLGPHFSRQMIKVGEGIAGEAAKTGQPMVLIDDNDTSSIYRFPRTVREQGLHTILSVPLKFHDRIIGLLNTYHRKTYIHTQAEISLLSTIANQAAIALENARLYKEQLSISEIIRTSLLPQKTMQVEGLDISYRYIPSMELSGDYYELIQIEPGRIGLAVADVAGKGTPAAIYTARTKYILKSYASAGHLPARVLTLVNQMLVTETAPDKFISCFYSLIDLERKRIYYSSGGHEPPIFWDAQREECHLLENDGLLLGIEPDAVFTQKSIKFGRGDMLVIYTDGVTEARDVTGEIFGTERLMELVSRHADQGPEALVNRIHASVQRYTRRQLGDDLTLLAVRF